MRGRVWGEVFKVLAERLCLEIGAVSDGGIFYSEKRNGVLDREFDLASGGP